MNKFICPKCLTKVPWVEMLNFKKNHITLCSNCNSHLIPKNQISFLQGFIPGVLGFIVPAKTITYLYDNILFGFFAGVTGAICVIVFLLIYIYKMTKFTVIK